MAVAAASSTHVVPLFRPHIAEGLHQLHRLAIRVLEEAHFLLLSAQDHHGKEMDVDLYDSKEDDDGTEISKVFVLCVVFFDLFTL